MKKQIVSMTLFIIICALFTSTNVLAQGVAVYKKTGEVMKIPYEELDSIVTYNNEGENIIQTEMVQGHECIDLGLSVKWATCNIGADTPEEYGDYYAWGETSTKSEYSWETYKWCRGTATSLTKYCSSSSLGSVDYKSVLDKSDDVAYVRWGNKWRMPTYEEVRELYDKCHWEDATCNGINGRLVTGPNGNSIFLPYSGWYNNQSNLIGCGESASYWSSTTRSSDYNASYHNLHSCVGNAFRFNGYTVRPVTE